MENLTKTKKYTTVKKKKEKKKKHAKGHDAVSGVSDLRSAHIWETRVRELVMFIQDVSVTSELQEEDAV